MTRLHQAYKGHAHIIKNPREQASWHHKAGIGSSSGHYDIDVITISTVCKQRLLLLINLVGIVRRKGALGTGMGTSELAILPNSSCLVVRRASESPVGTRVQ